VLAAIWPQQTEHNQDLCVGQSNLHWPKDVPVTEAEIAVFKTWFGDLFDDLFGDG
jgi:hypothetical protein